ncbi:efflux RND transporter periplasmic adaptor subunit [Patescibacteria group bacterium]|nr:efflux RND transporter periplasmic adaptor subunit [Patescibacteria group bacterium]
MLQFALRRAQKSIVIIVIAILASGGLGYWYFAKSNLPQSQLVAVTRGTISQEVTVTGNTKPEQSVDLAFEKSGKVAAVFAGVGDAVSAGMLLVKLDASELLASLAEAEANVDAQNAKLAELKSGTRPEEIQIDEIKVVNAASAFDDAKRGLIDKLNDAYTKSDDAVRNTADEFFSNPRSSNPQFNFSGTDPQLKSSLEHSRFLLESALADWNASLQALSLGSELGSYADAAKNNLGAIKSFLDGIALAINSLTPSSSAPQSTIDTYKANVATARANINAAIANLSSAVEKWRSQDSALTLAQNELALAKAGTVSEQVAAQEAAVKQAQAKRETIQAQIAKTVLYSPIAGVITKQEAKVGEIAPANVALVSVISKNKFEIDANVPEADIAKISLGNRARVSLDAYGSDVIFAARVGRIDPAETIVDGVPTYLVKFQFDDEDPRIKSGMTANIDIETVKKEGVLLLPQRVVVRKNNETIVTRRDTTGDREIKIEIGIRGTDGMIEVVSGLQEGDRIVVSSE